MSAEDVKLLARRSTALVRLLQIFLPVCGFLRAWGKMTVTSFLVTLSIYNSCTCKACIFYMRRHIVHCSICLYFSQTTYKIKVKNWPGSREIPKRRVQWRGRAERQRRAENEDMTQWSLQSLFPNTYIQIKDWLRQTAFNGNFMNFTERDWCKTKFTLTSIDLAWSEWSATYFKKNCSCVFYCNERMLYSFTCFGL